MGGTGSDAGGEQPLSGVDHAPDEQQAGPVTQRRQDGEQTLLRPLDERLRTADDENLRAPEQQRRAQVVERLLEALDAVVGPQRADVVGPAGGREPPAQQAECALDEERLLTVEEVVSRERRRRERTERTGDAAQNPSMAWR
jgi:hypothetical protein